jgi:hypothetical protein
MKVSLLFLKEEPVQRSPKHVRTTLCIEVLCGQILFNT